MSNRRTFIKKSVVFSMFSGGILNTAQALGTTPIKINSPILLATWAHGLRANDVGWKILSSGGSAIDAVEKGVMVVESDPEVTSVGFGGFPDREGFVTLDACIMDSTGNAGSVAFLQNIENPIAVARKVMDDTPHVMIVGAGALQFAKEQGFEQRDLLTENAKKAWKKWLIKSQYKPVINVENHDTIGQIAMDTNGNLSGACTTSGAAFKMHGRVGDSPLIGSGLFVDNEVGAACATGLGEEIIKVSGSHLVVELMRQGATADEACKEALLES